MSESDVSGDGFRALLTKDRQEERWLHNQVGPALDALVADPSCAVTSNQVRICLAAEAKVIAAGANEKIGR